METSKDFLKETRKNANILTLVNFFTIAILFVMFLLLTSCNTTKRCPTYGYRKIEVNGKKYYFDPGARSPYRKR